MKIEKESRLLHKNEETVSSADNQQETNHKLNVYVVGSSTTTRQTSLNKVQVGSTFQSLKKDDDIV